MAAASGNGTTAKTNGDRNGENAYDDRGREGTRFKPAYALR